MADFKTGVGDPGSKHYGEVLSEAEEKQIDSKGERVVDGAPWSTVPTGLWLCVLGCKPVGPAPLGLLSTGHTRSLLVGDTLLAISVTPGRPTWNRAGHGVCLELPADLGRDGLKQTYVTEWLVETAREIFTARRTKVPEGQEDTLAIWLANQTDLAIRSTGL